MGTKGDKDERSVAVGSFCREMCKKLDFPGSGTEAGDGVII